jgi:hypothetical protein
LGQDEPIGGNHQDVCPEGAKRFLRLCTAKSGGLKYRKPALERQALHWAGHRLQAASRRPIRLRKHQRDVVPGVYERCERSLGELRGAGES